MNQSASSVSLSSASIEEVTMSQPVADVPAVVSGGAEARKLANPRIVIPTNVVAMATRTAAISNDAGNVEGSGHIVTPRGSYNSLSTMKNEGSREKVGRWTEDEHNVFLDGLEKHGKQWKIIAGMIGTRTVVQVRTHAQKYFQRMERHGMNASKATSAAAPSTKPSTSKRKMSLPASMPSRAVKKSKTSKKVSRSASLTMAPSKSPVDQTLAANYSKAATVPSDSDWSTFSPTGVIEMADLDLDCFRFPTVATAKDASETAQAESSANEFKDLGGQDPLAWLVDVEPSILPESSLPVFPDLSTGVDSSEHYSEENVVSEESSAGSVSSLVDDSILNGIVDPSVTVQSLLLLPDGLEE